MNHLSDDYYLRKYYLETDQIPSHNVMIEKMRPALANVCVKYLTPKEKVLVGLDERKGGGAYWYMPPEEVLAGRAVLKPMDKGLTELGFFAINDIGEKLRYERYKELIEEKRQIIIQNDNKWKQAITESNKNEYEEVRKEETRKNTQKILDSFHQFEVLYKTSMTKLETLINQAAMKEVEKIRNEAFIYMKERCESLVMCQATQMYKEYDENLQQEKEIKKAAFIKAVENLRKDTANRIHDINYDKHVAIEKLRHILDCQNVACQIYVAFKEKNACEDEINQTKHEYNKKVAVLKQKLNLQNADFRKYEEHQARRKELDEIWITKICQVVKKFQLFVEYCLRTMPQHAEFFINMEKLLLLQINEVLEKPDAESIIEAEPEYKPPVARPHPFYLCCDKRHKGGQIDQHLCPEHCTSSASHLPVVVINKRYFYSACDNFQLFADKVSQYLQGNRGDDVDIKDSEDYNVRVPVKSTSAQRLQDLKLESSLLRILQEEIPNVNNVAIVCSVCKLPFCYCDSSVRINFGVKQRSSPKLRREKSQTRNAQSSSLKFVVKSELEPQMRHAPDLESYMDYVTPKKCQCSKMAKKQLRDHLPPYMWKTSQFEPPELPDYEPCTLETLKQLVKRAKTGRNTLTSTGRSTPQTGTIFVKRRVLKKDAATQYSDKDFEFLCTCYSDDELPKCFGALVKSTNMAHNKKQIASSTNDDSTNLLELLFKNARNVHLSHSAFRRVDDVSSSYLTKSMSSFATDRAYSLRSLLNCDSNLEDIFTKTDCDSN